MKCCCRLSTTCIIFASFYIAAGIFISISSIISMFDSNYADEEHKRNNDIASIKIICASLVTILITSLYIVAIVKKYHYLILPWLLMIICIFPLSCLYMFMVYFAAGMASASYFIFIIIIIVSLLLIVAQITIFCLSISMFNKIRRENNARSNNTSVSYQAETPEYTAIIDKSVI